jgi:nucleotide-binding universal stress UspA family protein
MKRILIPIDFSELSEYAFSIAKEIQAKNDAELICLNIIHVGKDAMFNYDGTLSSSNDFDVKAFEKLRVEHEAKMNQFVQNSKNTKGLVRIGNIESDILHCEKNESVDLIIMGTHGSEGLAQQLSGTIADKIIRLANAPVISLKCKRETSEFKDILLAGDFNPPIKDNISQLKELATIFGAKLHLLRVNTPFNKEKKEIIEHQMDQYCELNEIESADFHIIEGKNVESGVTEFAEKNNIEFIAIGSRGRMGISAFFNGCVSADLVNHLHKPVFTFRA